MRLIRVIAVIFLFWGQQHLSAQTLLAVQDFETTPATPTLSISAGTPVYVTGSSGTGDRPASSAYFYGGARAWGETNSSKTLTFGNVSLSGYTSCYAEFRLASWSISSTGNGADAADIVTVSISTDGGTNYYSTVRVLGNSNAYWYYSATGIATATYDGDATPVDFSPAGGGPRTTDGYSTVRVDLPASATQVAVRITVLNNATGERWTIDDVKIFGTVSTCTPPSITAAPSSTTVCEGSAATFSCAATGTTPVYQWQENQGSGWTNITNGGIYSNATTATLNISSVTMAMYGWQYQCYISNSCGNSTTASATLSVNPAPATPAAPVAAANPACSSTTLSAASPPAGETYYWQGTSSASTSTALPAGFPYSVSSSGTYYLRSQNTTTGCWSAASSLAVTINSAPAISSHPSSTTSSVGGNATFTVTASGAGLIYQWQEDQGGGFINISDGGIYSGTATASLTLSSVTLSMNGYQYRCIVSGTCSPSATSNSATLTVVTTLSGDYRTRASGNWTSNTCWEKWNGSAWVACSAGDYPNSTTASATVQAHTIDFNSSPQNIKNITVETGGRLWTNSFTGSNLYLQVYGNITCNGTIGLVTGDDLCFDIAGGNNCIISGAGSFAATRIRKDQNINSSLTSSLLVDMDVFLLWSSASGTVLYNDATSSNFDITISAGKTLKGVTTGTVSNNISLDGLSGRDNAQSGGSITIYGTLEVDGTIFATTNNTLASRSVTYTVKNGGTMKCAYMTDSASSSAGAAVIVESGGKIVLTGANSSSNAWSSFSTTNNSYSLAAGSTVEYAGAAAQNVESGLSYSNITFSGGGNKTLNGPTSVSGTATFTSGIVYSSSTNPLQMSAGSSAASASNSSFVSGPVIKSGSTDFVFPVGKDAGYRPIAISNIAGTEIFNAEYFHTGPHPTYDSSLRDASLTHVSACEYWILNRTGTNNATVSLSWDTYSCGVTSLPALAVARWDGSMWKDHGNGGTSGTTAGGWISSSGAVTSFSPFTLASTVSALNPLPVELVSFSGKRTGEKVSLSWTTASEINNDHFTVERSSDGLEFEPLFEVAGQGTKTTSTNYSAFDEKPLSATVSFYRLLQTDFDGSTSYSNVINITANSTGFEILGTTVTENELVINIGAVAEQQAWLRIFDQNGRIILYSQVVIGQGLIRITLPDMSQGLYFLQLSTETRTTSAKFVK